MVNGLVAAVSNQECFVGELVGTWDRPGAEHGCWDSVQIRECTFVFTHGGCGQGGLKSVVVREP